jgi:hypothetical protein
MLLLIANLYCFILQSSLSTLAHAGGVLSLEVHGEMIASCGFSRRMGQVVPDNTVKVFDCR